MKVRPGVAADVDEHERRDPEGRQVGEGDADDQVERSDEAAQHEREQQPDREDRDRDDVDEVVVGGGADVVERGRLAGDPVGAGARARRRPRDDRADLAAWR